MKLKRYITITAMVILFGMIGIPATMNFYFVDRGLPVVQAGAFVGAFYIFMLVGRLSGVPLATRFSSRTMLSAAVLVGCVLIVLATLWPEEVGQVKGILVNVYFLVLTGLCCFVMRGTIFNVAVEKLGKSVELASGIFMTMVCGGGLLPFLQNVLSVRVGYFESYWMIFACLAYIAFYALRESRLKKITGNINITDDKPINCNFFFLEIAIRK